MGSRKAKLIVRLKGGLGNQMFQYAAGRALAVRNDAKLVLDTHSGFYRDQLYRRSFALGLFSIEGEIATVTEWLPFFLEECRRRTTASRDLPVAQRIYGTYIRELKLEYLGSIANHHILKNTWMEGIWRSERYFSDLKDTITHELAPPRPVESSYLTMAERMKSSNSVAVGVRLFEEVQSSRKANVGGVVPINFYETAAKRVAEARGDCTFFVFSTCADDLRGRLSLPGEIHYVTPDTGFASAVQTLWLLIHCKHHILSNSSFYWWGAWLSERNDPSTTVAVCDMFPNRDSIPDRWARYSGEFGGELPLIA